jgi:hypothetical protein
VDEIGFGFVVTRFLLVQSLRLCTWSLVVSAEYYNILGIFFAKIKGKSKQNPFPTWTVGAGPLSN